VSLVAQGGDDGFFGEVEHPEGDPRILSMPDAKPGVTAGSYDLDDRDDVADLVVIAEVGFDRVHLLSHFVHQLGTRVRLWVTRVGAGLVSLHVLLFRWSSANHGSLAGQADRRRSSCDID
jgi:hypothetical protein